MDYEIGSTIKYRAFGGEERIVWVTETEDDIKNGMPGFGGIELNGTASVWGYDYQIIEVVKR